MSWWKTILIIIVGLCLGVGFGLARWYKTGGLQQAVVQSTVHIFTSDTTTISLVDELVGLNDPQSYLLLLMNNTELRPGGGFIGAYAVVTLNKAVPSIVKVEGTEILDNYAPQDFPSVPPAPLANYLKVARWNFRDSNWWPDFRSSTQKSLELYAKEKGVLANSIRGVIGITPTAVEELLKITGPITVDGQEFNSSNFTEKVEYEVELGYAAKGVEFNNRKKLLGDFAKVLMQKLRGDLLTNWKTYFALTQNMLRQKHIMAYATDPAVENIILSKDWGGAMHPSDGDYVLWADANLGALKTDASINRSLTYSLNPATSSGYVATAQMRYNHTGSFDWRTSRYRTYARVYAPLGSTLISSAGALKEDRSSVPGTVDIGVENGYQWFGAFISIEPGKTGELRFTYKLPESIANQIKNHTYHLLVQKQPGTIAQQLTLGLNFDTTVTAAHPGEEPKYYGDKRYDYITDLRVDREFDIKFK